MNRLQVVLAVGLFLIVALFGWKTYLEKSSQQKKSDQRGLPAKFQDDVKTYKKNNPAPTPKAAPTPSKDVPKATPNDDSKARQQTRSPTPILHHLMETSLLSEHTGSD